MMRMMEKKNIMKGTIKIIYFDYSIYLTKGELAKTILRSPINMSPILLNGLITNGKDIRYNEKEDVCSLETICDELLMGKSAFDSKDLDELAEKINKGDYLPTRLSKEIVSFISCMLQFESDKRPSFEELSHHEFLKKNVNEFRRIEFKELENETMKENSSILLNTKSNEIFKLIVEMEFKKAFSHFPIIEF